MIRTIVGLAAVLAAGLLVWRRRRRGSEGSPIEGEVYESGGMVRVGPVPDAPADRTPQA